MKKTKIIAIVAGLSVFILAIFLISTQSGKNLKGLTAIEFEPKLDLIELDTTPTLINLDKELELIPFDPSAEDVTTGESPSTTDSDSIMDAPTLSGASDFAIGEVLDLSESTGWAAKVCLIDENNAPIQEIPNALNPEYVYGLSSSENPDENCYHIQFNNGEPSPLNIFTENYQSELLTLTPKYWTGLKEYAQLEEEIIRLSAKPTSSIEREEEGLGALSDKIDLEIYEPAIAYKDYPVTGIKWCLEDKNENLLQQSTENIISELPAETSLYDEEAHCYISKTSEDTAFMLTTDNYAMLNSISLSPKTFATPQDFEDEVPAKLMLLAKAMRGESTCSESAWTLDTSNNIVTLSIQGQQEAPEAIAQNKTWKDKIIQVAKSLKPSMWMASLITPDPQEFADDIFDNDPSLNEITISETFEGYRFDDFGPRIPHEGIPPIGFGYGGGAGGTSYTGGGMGTAPRDTSETGTTSTESASDENLFTPKQSEFTALFLVEDNGAMNLESHNPRAHHRIARSTNAFALAIVDSDNNTFRFSYNPAPSERTITLRGLCPSTLTIPGVGSIEAPRSEESTSSTTSTTSTESSTSEGDDTAATPDATPSVTSTSSTTSEETITPISIFNTESSINSSSSDETEESVTTISTSYVQSTKNEEQWASVEEKVKENSIYKTECDHGFKDVEGERNEGLICVLQEMGIVKGKSKDFFGYKDTTTVAEFLKMLLSMAGEKESDGNSKFTDGYHWGEGWLARAEELDILRRRDGFPPDVNLPITKADAMLYTMRLLGKTYYPSSSSIEDVDVEDYFAYAVLYLKNFKTTLPGEAERELIRLNDGRFEPYDYMTRGETTEFIVSLFYAKENLAE